MSTPQQQQDMQNLQKLGEQMGNKAVDEMNKTNKITQESKTSQVYTVKNNESMTDNIFSVLGVVLAKRKFTTLSQLFTIQHYYQNILS
jgi:hypothetical protein